MVPVADSLTLDGDARFGEENPQESGGQLDLRPGRPAVTAPGHDTMNLPFFDERPFIHDITSDGLPDVVGIRGSGQLSQWQNVGGALLDNIAVYNADWTMEAVLIADLLG